MNINTDFKHNIVTMNNNDKDKMKQSGFLYDIEGAPNFPDVPQLLSNIIEIMEYMTEDDMIKLREEDFQQFEQQMEAKFPDFSFRYYAIFQRIILGEDLGFLFEMLKQIHRVNCNEDTAENVEKMLGEELGRKYIKKVDNTSTGKKKKKGKK